MSKEDLKKQIELLVRDDESNQQTIIKQSEEIERLNNIIDKAENELFNLKDMIYKSETREINFDIQRKISSIIKILILGEELKGRNNDGQSFIQQKI